MSARRRGATALSGIVCVDKPAGMTSHDVVARVRKATGEGRVGHAGTLDPMATGLLVVLIGPATRLEPYLSTATKSYEATIEFGSATDTDDAEGAIIDTAPVPPAVTDTVFAEKVLAGFLGESMQTPPIYSAIKTDGRPAHRVARAGGDVPVAPRAIRVEEAGLLRIDEAGPAWRVAFRVSKGTYVRALARDIGRAAGTHAHLTALRRTQAGPLTLADATMLEEVETAASAGELEALMTDPVAALGLPSIQVDPIQVADGRPIAADSATSSAPQLPVHELVAVVGGDPSTLLALYRSANDRLVPVAVMPGGVSRGVR